MTVSQYDHVVPYTDLGGRGYFGVNAALVKFVSAWGQWMKHDKRAQLGDNGWEVDNQLVALLLAGLLSRSD